MKMVHPQITIDLPEDFQLDGIAAPTDEIEVEIAHDQPTEEWRVYIHLNGRTLVRIGHIEQSHLRVTSEKPLHGRVLG